MTRLANAPTEMLAVDDDDVDRAATARRPDNAVKKNAAVMCKNFISLSLCCGVAKLFEEWINLDSCGVAFLFVFFQSLTVNDEEVCEDWMIDDDRTPQVSKKREHHRKDRVVAERSKDLCAATKEAQPC